MTCVLHAASLLGGNKERKVNLDLTTNNYNEADGIVQQTKQVNKIKKAIMHCLLLVLVHSFRPVQGTLQR